MSGVTLPCCINPIIAKYLAVGADQKVTNGEFRKQNEILIASCKSRGEADCQAVIYATAGFPQYDQPGVAVQEKAGYPC